MKNHTVLFLLLLTTITVHAQWDGPDPVSGDIHYNNGNVGIGISSPIRNLHIRGTSNVVQVDRNSNSPSVGLTRYSPYWTTIYKSFHIAVRADAADNGQFQIIDQHQQTGGNGDVRFVIDNAGRIGIGTTDPMAPFHVKTGSKGALFENTVNGRKIEIDPGSGLIDIQNATLNLNRLSGSNISLVAGGGNVGIGAGTPSTKLEVFGDPNTTAVILNNENFIGFKRADGALVYGIGHTDSGFTIGASANLGPNAGTPIHIAAGSPSAQIKFFQNTHERMRIASNGYVGIGTTSPDAKLTVSGGGVFENESNGRRITIDPGSGLIDIQNATLNLNRFSGSNISLVAGGGNVGIGAGTPSTKLEVFGDPNTTAVILNNENFIGFKRADGALVYGIGHTNSEFTIGATANLGPTAGTPIHIAAGSPSAQIKFFQNIHERMRIASNGYVGIGTTSPDAKLTVNGDIHAKKVRVDLNVPGPDYVFEEDYDLPTLESLQNYIRENRHLPEVPSAGEMEENGIDVGMMNMVLLKKVEELTLYIIAQAKEVKELNEKVTGQQKEIESLKTKKEDL